MKPAFHSHVLILTCVAALAIGQLLFKALSQRSDSLMGILNDRASILMFAGALGIYAASTLLWIVVLRSVPLSYAYMFMSAGFVLVPLAAHFLFDEPLSPKFILGALFIAIGIWLAASSTA